MPFWREMKRTGVYCGVERGEGGEAGGMRLIFCDRGRSWSLTLEEKLDDNPLGWQGCHAQFARLLDARG